MELSTLIYHELITLQPAHNTAQSCVYRKTSYKIDISEYLSKDESLYLVKKLLSHPYLKKLELLSTAII